MWTNAKSLLKTTQSLTQYGHKKKPQPQPENNLMFETFLTLKTLIYRNLIKLEILLKLSEKVCQLVCNLWTSSFS